MAGGAQARAAVILRSTTAQISGQAQFISPNVSVEESGSIRTRPGAPDTLEFFVGTTIAESGAQWFPFPRTLDETEFTRRAFSSSEVNANGGIEVGVSGSFQALRDGESAIMFATAVFGSDVWNFGDGLADVSLDLEIPRMTLAVTTPPRPEIRVTGEVTASLGWISFTPEGELWFSDEVFALTLGVIDGGLDLEESIDLLARTDVARESPCLGCIALTATPFALRDELITLLSPGEHLEFTYRVSAVLRFDGLRADDMVGGHAFFGDPFNVGGGGGAFHIPTLTSVPVPPMAWAFTTGLFALFVSGRRRRAGHHLRARIRRTAGIAD
ncbi:MAG: hypothetical protein AB7O21_18345 [Gammaproteobacteria bacterium]